MFCFLKIKFNCEYNICTHNNYRCRNTCVSCQSSWRHYWLLTKSVHLLWKLLYSCALWCSVLGSFSPFLYPKQLRNGSKPHIFSSSLLNKQNPQKRKSCCPTPPPPPPDSSIYEYCCWTWIFHEIKTWDCEVMRSKRFGMYYPNNNCISGFWRTSVL